MEKAEVGQSSVPLQEQIVLNNPRFSVLLVVKNARPLLAGTLASLKSQTLKDFEVIVADGASTDGTLQMLHQATHDLPLRIVSEPDRSLSEGLAKVFRRTNGEMSGCCLPTSATIPTLSHKCGNGSKSIQTR